MTYKVPILFIIFNRPETAKKVFEVIRKMKPEKLFISADGPRKNRKHDEELCNQTKEIVSRVDWPCKVYKKFNSENLGCKKSVVSALNWFFDIVDEGIILEDDCLPNLSFFSFTESLLGKYRNDERIYQICGTNPLDEWNKNGSSYFFSYYGSIWGWATWKRAWNKVDIEMKLWKNKSVRKSISGLVADRLQYIYRKSIYDASFKNKIDAWSYAWSFARIINSGLSVVPSVNLIKNLGFGSDSSHTKSRKNAFSSQKIYSIKFPLKEPEYIIADRVFDKKYFLKLAVYSKFYSAINLPGYFFDKLKKTFLTS